MDKEEPNPAEDAAPTLDRSMLPSGLQDELAKLGRRPRQGPLRAMILRLCAWRPLRAAELAAILQARPDKLTERHLAAMLSAGALVRTHPENPTHPDQAYRAVQPELPADDHDEDSGVEITDWNAPGSAIVDEINKRYRGRWWRWVRPEALPRSPRR